MKGASLALAGVLLFASTALAERGDQLRVTADEVNVRARPALGAAVLLKVDRNQRAIEVSRQDGWVQVLLPGQRRGGWIHASLVGGPGEPAATRRPGQDGRAPAAPAPAAPQERALASALRPAETVLAAVQGGDAPAPEVGPAPAPRLVAPGSSALERFRASVEYLDRRAVGRGARLFAGVETHDAGAVRVVATERWASVPEETRADHLASLFDRWLAASSGTGPLRLDIVNRDGKVLMTRTGP